jgi:hypothetical protein
MKPRGFLDPEQFPHGTRSRYTAGACRCDPCRAANRDAYRVRRARELELLAELGPEPAAPAPPIVKVWRPRGGEPRARTYRRACPGVKGRSCRRQTFVRSDSVGGVCATCRRSLAFNGLVPANRARRHIFSLARQGIGLMAVAAAGDLGHATLWAIKTGRKKRIMASTSARILAIDKGARADGALVPARQTWHLIRDLLAEGFTRRAIAVRALGCKSKNPQLQLRRDRVTARNAHAIAKFYRQVMN